MTTNKRKRLFHLLGAGLVAFWAVMIVLLVRRVEHPRPPGDSVDAGAVAAIDAAEREWREIYLGEKKVGYAVHLIKPFGKGYFIQEEMLLKLNLMGMASGFRAVTQARVDADFLLEGFHFTMTSGVVSFDISGEVDAEGVLVVQTGRGEERKERRIALGQRPMIGAGVGPFFRSRPMSVGDTFRIPLFDPASMSRKEAAVRVVAREPLSIRNIAYDALRLEMDVWGKTITLWLGEDGTTLKEEGLMGLTTIKSSAANASLDLEGGGEVDLYEMTAVNADRRLPDPERMGYLKIRLDGLEGAGLDPGVLTGGRQSYRAGEMEIRREALPLKGAYALPYAGGEAAMAPFLRPEFNIESDDAAILAAARGVLGAQRDPLVAARELTNWVFLNLEKRPVLSIPSATEVLRTRVGDCNEHATLLTALLRASGIPSRLAVGLVYTRGKFLYHAWTEAYLGEWISMDATLNQMPVDATHIKLVEGNLDQQVQIAGLIGALDAKVIEYRRD